MDPGEKQKWLNLSQEQEKEIRAIRAESDRIKEALEVQIKTVAPILKAADALEDWLFKYSSPGPQQKVSIHIKNPKDDDALLGLLRDLRTALKPIRKAQ